MIDKTSSNLQLFVQTIRNKIDSYNPPLNEDEIVRCMYLMLGMKAVFDPTFTFGGGGQRIEHINRRKRLNYLDKITEDEEWSVICKDLARFMSYFGQCFDVDIKVVSSNPERLDGHEYNLVTKKNGECYAIDLSEDLRNIHFHARTMFFGINPNNMKYNIFTSQYIEAMDFRLNYISPERYYSDDYIYLLKSQTDLFESYYDRLTFAIENISPYPEKEYVGYNEITNHHKDVLKKAVGKTGWGFLNCYRYDENSKKIFEPIVVIYDEDKNEHYYEYKKVKYVDPVTGKELDIYSYRYVPVSIEEMGKKLIDGLIVPEMYNYYKQLYNESRRISRGNLLYGYDEFEYQ